MSIESVCSIHNAYLSKKLPESKFHFLESTSSTKQPMKSYSRQHDSFPMAGGDEETAATTTERQAKKQKGDRAKILVSSATNEWVNSLIARGAALPDDATAEERLTYRYNLSQQRKRLNKLQKSFNIGGSAEAGEDGGAQKQPAGKHRSRTRDMPPERWAQPARISPRTSTSRRQHPHQVLYPKLHRSACSKHKHT